MIYLIGQMAGWLVLAAVFAGIAGWAFAAQRAAPAEAAARRERNKLMRDLINIGVEEGAPANGVSEELERQMDILRRRAELDAARVAELEQAHETARSRADEAQGHAAELQRALDRSELGTRGAPAPQPLVTAPAEPAPIDVESHPVPDEESALQMWRLRYFEQRVRYLESNTQASPLAPPAPSVEDTSAANALEWRARTAEAQVAHLESELRAAAPAVSEPESADHNDTNSPFAANADIDTLLRWRLLYLERRVAHLKAQAERAVPVAPQPIVQTEAAPDPDRWKWRARYLEARVRHLETRAVEPAPAPASAAPTPAPQPVMAAPPLEAPPAAPPPLVPAGAEKRPSVLPAARNGAPDDLTLIDGVSLLQQTTLNSLGIYHFDQIAAWTPANVAWVDQYLRLRGRIVEEEWVEQAEDLASEGPDAARQFSEDEAV
jgi:predicted flap endonuclease-1-like 5' DNA nuclease